MFLVKTTYHKMLISHAGKHASKSWQLCVDIHTYTCDVETARTYLCRAIKSELELLLENNVR